MIKKIEDINLIIMTIRGYAMIIDDYINRTYLYTMESEYLEDDIKALSGALIESINELEEEME